MYIGFFYVINTIKEYTTDDMTKGFFSTSADGVSPPSVSSVTVRHIKTEPISTMDL